MNVKFYHSSPGTGTRVATISLQSVVPRPQVFFAFTWTPAEIALHFGTQPATGPLLSAKGVQSKKQFRIGSDGIVFQIGDEGIEVFGAKMYVAGKAIILPTAIEAWQDTLRAIRILETGKSDQGFIYECVTTNLSLAMLVTGFEVYAKRRFLELDSEGVKPDFPAIARAFLSKKDLASGAEERFTSDATSQGVSPISLFVEDGRINFQDFDKCKLAFNKGYGIVFGSLYADGAIFERINAFLKYRHRIVHVSPLADMLNPEEVPPKEPVFPKRELLVNAQKDFGDLIDKLHAATLSKR